MRLLLTVILGVCLQATMLSARIIETTSVSEIYKLLETDSTFVLFDVDDTLIHSTTHLGDKEWVSSIYDYFEADASRSEQFAMGPEDLIFYTSRRLAHKPVEGIVPHVIADLQSREGVTTLALTARENVPLTEESLDSNLTAHQLASIGIDFSRGRYSEEIRAVSSIHTGIIFTSYQMKGPFFVEFLATAGQRPTKVILVDDRLSQIRSFDEAMQAAGIPCDCLWYRHLEETKEVYDPWIALIQLKILLEQGQILTNSEALALRESYADVSFDALFEQVIRLYGALKK